MVQPVNILTKEPIEDVDSLAHTSVYGGGNGGGDDNMLQRVKDLEIKVATLVTDVAIIKDKLATKEDIQSVKTELHKELSAQTWKIITALVITVLLAVFSRYFIK
ncbi:hypothetical protein [Cedecea davisae]|nr:hypothetical protein [Cedecea davisae]